MTNHFSTVVDTDRSTITSKPKPMFRIAVYAKVYVVGHSILLIVKHKIVTIVTHSTVVGRHPHKTLMILKNKVRLITGQPVRLIIIDVIRFLSKRAYYQ